MKFTLSWLKDHLETEATLDEIVAKLTSIGLEVDGVEDPSEKFAPFKVAYVESAEQHPDADRLRVLMVNTGKETLQVVCGAPNAKAGMKGIFAPVGSYVPGIDIELKKGNIRGQESNGMMVSEREMGLSDEHDGIIELEGDPDIGTPFAKLFGMDDPVIEIGLTPNRADCAGVRGIARDLAAAGMGTLKPLKTKAVKGSFDSPIGVEFAFSKDDADACPLFLGRYVKNVKNGPSPEWLQNRLTAIGLRPISALVDITNYVSYDLCRPLHVFDADKVSGNLTVRLGKKGETLDALDEKTYEIPDFTTVIADDKAPLALGGIMGGMDSGCTDETANVFLEVAYFDPARTAKSGRALQIVSDARYRFERGVDPAFLPEATEIATQMILDLCGGEASNVVSTGVEPEWKRSIEYNPED
ncbi:MAG: phenylalanine--tRNA ligase subunit beta, partial [Pseudomonadota bacterium]|nr:phenylalanine--tRNA ligase subunit beta [Pseudomonadota bacterium]